MNFPKLRELHIGNFVIIEEDNMIGSIEPMVAIKAPHMRKLDMRNYWRELGRNLIMKIDCLKRCEFPELEELCLCKQLIDFSR